MRRGARQSQIINNFFSLATIVMVSVVLTLYVKYIVKEEKPKRVNSGLLCQKQNQTTDKIINKILLKKGFVLLNKGFYSLDGGIIPSLNTKSVITEEADLTKINNIFLNAIDINLNNEMQKFLTIKYELIENDKINSTHAGALLTSFRVNNNEVFRVLTDFNKYNEIKQRVECTLEAFKYNATK